MIPCLLLLWNTHRRLIEQVPFFRKKKIGNVNVKPENQNMKILSCSIYVSFDHLEREKYKNKKKIQGQIVFSGLLGIANNNNKKLHRITPADHILVAYTCTRCTYLFLLFLLFE